MEETFTDLASDVEVPETFAPLLKQTLETLVNFTDARRRTLRSLHAQTRWRCMFRDKFVLAVQAVETSAAKRTVDVTWTAHRNGFTCVSLHDPATKMSYDHTNSDPVRAKYIVSLMKDMLQAVFHTPPFSVVDADAVIELISVLNDDIETVVDRIPDTQQPMRRILVLETYPTVTIHPSCVNCTIGVRRHHLHELAMFSVHPPCVHQSPPLFLLGSR
jgi:hypothetical protein